MRRMLFSVALAAGLVAPQALGLAQAPAQNPVVPVVPVVGQPAVPVVGQQPAPVVSQPATPAVQAPTGPRLKLTFEPDGKVTLVSNGATLREILDEWSRKGNTPFVGADRLPGGPQILQYENQNEVEVMSSLLRSASGYVLAPRREGSTGASQFEAVFIVAQSTSTAVASSSGFQNTYTQPTVSTAGSAEEEISPARPGPGPQQAPAAPPPPAPRPAGASGVAVPVVPVVSVGPAGSSTTTPPPPTTTGRGGGGGGGGGR